MLYFEMDTFMYCIAKQQNIEVFMIIILESLVASVRADWSIRLFIIFYII
jgi:hypothetical protein